MSVLVQIHTTTIGLSLYIPHRHYQLEISFMIQISDSSMTRHRKKQGIIQPNYEKLLLAVEYVEKEIRINWQDFLYHCINIISFYWSS